MLLLYTAAVTVLPGSTPLRVWAYVLAVLALSNALPNAVKLVTGACVSTTTDRVLAALALPAASVATAFNV